MNLYFCMAQMACNWDPASCKHVTNLNVLRSLSLIPDRKSRHCTGLTVRLSVY